jgi:hypothetical protein
MSGAKGLHFNMHTMKVIMSLSIVLNLLVIISSTNHSVDARPSTLVSKKPPFNGSIFGKRSSPPAPPLGRTDPLVSNSIAWKESQLKEILQEYIANCLDKTNVDPIIGYDCACFRNRLALIDCELENSRELARAPWSL